MTRRATFLARRERYIAAGKRAANRGRVWAKINGRWVVIGRKWQIARGPLQIDTTYHPKDKVAGVPPVDPLGITTIVVTGGGFKAPPHVAHLFAGMPWQSISAGHTSNAVAGYHRRPVHAIRRQPGRRSKLWRQDWGARAFAWTTGAWPVWDVLARHPNTADVQGGAPPLVLTAFPPPGVPG